jgi:predicted transcriptional regulator
MIIAEFVETIKKLEEAFKDSPTTVKNVTNEAMFTFLKNNANYLRKLRGYASQLELSLEANVAQSVISNIEHGKPSTVSYSALLRLVSTYLILEKYCNGNPGGSKVRAANSAKDEQRPGNGITSGGGYLESMENV